MGDTQFKQLQGLLIHLTGVIVAVIGMVSSGEYKFVVIGFGVLFIFCGGKLQK